MDVCRFVHIRGCGLGKTSDRDIIEHKRRDWVARKRERTIGSGCADAHATSAARTVTRVTVGLFGEQ
jgi:hypothetical protein